MDTNLIKNNKNFTTKNHRNQNSKLEIKQKLKENSREIDRKNNE